ncbi:ribosomal s35, mitochondrial [Trichoderma arundinaceum]|uniref:Ribosomal s35, mitochondrial n=1 Tax=Trichoderma arundinaceum TaxID=490622 RepID=A0A395NHY1_TRIAR|nr:ribosomal s35, mitochondrial [Trichoderma arundinaceum]
MPPRLPAAAPPLGPVVDACVLQSCRSAPLARSFSSTPCRQKMSRARQQMFQWLKGREGSEFADPGRGGGPRYLGPLQDQPFPLNPLFRSQPVLDEQTRELIWDKVMGRGESLKAVSAEMGVDVRRVAAVGKKLAVPYAKAVMGMLPKTSYREGEKNLPHEPVNEIHVHKLTMQQLFVPVSESRHFTREDAAKAFHDSMLSVDTRSPQPELIKMEREILEGKTRQESLAKFKEATQKEEDRVAQRIAQEQQREEKATTRVTTDRYEFRFKEINADDVGRNGRSRKGTGWRYGAPFDDRKRGLVKIPTSVP